jgi:hypothetical protein
LLSALDPDGQLDTPEERAAAFASQWTMIPLTRAMDTLVINVSDKPSAVKQALAKLQRERKDFVEWIDL